MIDRRGLMAGGAAALLAGCGAPGPRIPIYDGPPVTALVAYKARRRLILMNEAQVLRDYRFDLGFAPVGHKQFEGDGKTPEGQYWIDRKNPNSAYHLSVGISYPNERDRSYARSQGRSPGGDIFIHGTPRRYERVRDWTAGCIAVDNREIEEIYSMVRTGTPIVILP